MDELTRKFHPDSQDRHQKLQAMVTTDQLQLLVTSFTIKTHLIQETALHSSRASLLIQTKCSQKQEHQAYSPAVAGRHDSRYIRIKGRGLTLTKSNHEC